MAVSVEQIRGLLRDYGIRYMDGASDSIEQKHWNIEFWLPTQKYRFLDREGLNTVVRLSEEDEETGNFNYIQMGVFGCFGTEDLSKIPDLLLRINRLNDRMKVIKWTLSTGQNKEGTEDVRVHVQSETWWMNSEMSTEQFWRSHGALWNSIEENWEAFAEDLGIRIRPKSTEISQKEPEELTDADKQKLVEMFGEYLDEQFENS